MVVVRGSQFVVVYMNGITRDSKLTSMKIDPVLKSNQRCEIFLPSGVQTGRLTRAARDGTKLPLAKDKYIERTTDHTDNQVCRQQIQNDLPLNIG